MAEYISRIEALQIEFLRRNESEIEREKLEHVFCVKFLITYFLRHNEREKAPNIFSLLRFRT